MKYGDDRPGGSQRFDQVDSYVGHGENYHRFLTWPIIPDEFLPAVVGLVPKFGFEIIDRAMQLQTRLQESGTPIDWTNVCSLYSVRALSPETYDNLAGIFSDENIAPEHRLPAYICQLERRWSAGTLLTTHELKTLSQIAQSLHLRPLDFMGLVSMFKLYSHDKTDITAFTSIARQITQDEVTTPGFHPTVSRLFRTSKKDGYPKTLAGNWDLFCHYSDYWEVLPLISRIQTEQQKEELLGYFKRIPRQFHYRFLLASSEYKNSELAKYADKIPAVVEKAESMPIETDDNLRWGAADITAIWGVNNKNVPTQCLKAFPAGPYFYIVPAPKHQRNALITLRFKNAEYPQLKKFGYLQHSYIDYPHSNGYCDLFASLEISWGQRIGDGQVLLDENQSRAFRYLPISLRKRYAGWREELFGFAKNFALQFGSNLRLPTAREKCNSVFTEPQAREDYDLPALRTGFTFSDDRKWLTFSSDSASNP